LSEVRNIFSGYIKKMSEDFETGSDNNQNSSEGQILLRFKELSDLLERDPLTVDINEFNEIFTRVMNEKKKRLRSLVKVEPEIYWITVNPKPGVELPIIMKTIHNFCNRKAVIDYHYTFEQRGESELELGKGIHCHMLILWNKKQNKYLKQFLKESCGRIVGSTNNNILNIRRITSDIYQDKLDYLEGKKWDKEKDLKIKMDKFFREKNNILCIYKKNADE